MQRIFILVLVLWAFSILISIVAWFGMIRMPIYDVQRRHIQYHFDPEPSNNIVPFVQRHLPIFKESKSASASMLRNTGQFDTEYQKLEIIVPVTIYNPNYYPLHFYSKTLSESENFRLVVMHDWTVSPRTEMTELIPVKVEIPQNQLLSLLVNVKDVVSHGIQGKGRIVVSAWFGSISRSF